MKATHIVWETDGEKVNLPTEMHIPEDVLVEGEDGITDYLSDQTGWLVESWSGQDAESQEEIDRIRKAEDALVRAMNR